MNSDRISKEEKLEKIVESLYDLYSMDEAELAISHEGPNEGDQYFTGNRQGLIRLAYVILETVVGYDIEPYQDTQPLEYLDWIGGNSSQIPSEMRFTNKTVSNHNANEVYKDTVLDQLIPYGCGLIVLLGLVCTIVGAYHIFHWLFP